MTGGATITPYTGRESPSPPRTPPRNGGVPPLRTNSFIPEGSANAAKQMPSMRREITGLQRPPSYSRHGMRSSGSITSGKQMQQDSLFSQFMSIRVVLVLITILTVIAMAVGLIVLSVQAQHSIVNDLSSMIQDGVAAQINDELDSVLQYAEDELYASRMFFQTNPNFTVIPIGQNPLSGMPTITDYIWSIVRKRPNGMEAEFDMLDGRFYGTECFNSVCDMFWADIVNGTLFEADWPLALNETIQSANLSIEAASWTYTYPPDTTTPDPITFVSCTSPAQWFNLYAYVIGDARIYLIFTIATVCNAHGEYIGTMAVSVGLTGVVDLLEELTTDLVSGKILIMDNEQRIVATSTDSDVFTFYDDGSSVQNHINTTNEKWINQLNELMDGKYGEQHRTVHVNGSAYYLTVTRYNKFNGIDWYIVKLLDQKQFLGNTKAYFTKSILAAAFVTAAALGVVILVTWGMTNPLFILATDLQKMSRLDFNVSDMGTPRLLEVGRLYRSVASMYIALQSFKKFVPVQVISKIMRSEKEVTAELLPAKVTIVFQDIEGFTSLSEKMDPVALAKLTSEYMETMTEIICRHGGTIDKYIGDCIMSLFNAPDELGNHPTAATRSAVECMRTLAAKNIEWKNQYGCEILCRIGINTGEVLVGNMGGENRMNYTAFGDNVNVAARLEGVNKHFGTRILISKSVYTDFPENPGFAIRKLAKVRVSGKSLPTSIYEVRGDNSQGTLQLFALYKRALQAFKKKDFNAAKMFITEASTMDPKDKACKQLQMRIEDTLQEGVTDQWSYVEDMSKL